MLDVPLTGIKAAYEHCRWSLNKIELRRDLYYLEENLRTLFGPTLLYNTQDLEPVYKYHQTAEKKGLGIKSLVSFYRL
jgi:hypothetical protein